MPTSSPARRVRPRAGRGLVAAVTALAGAALIGAALAWPSPDSPTTTPDSSTQISAPTSVPPTTASPLPTSSTPSSSAPGIAPAGATALQESVPTRVRIPDIDVDAGTTELGLDGAQLETPDDPAEVGWFHGAHTPGGPGRAVLAGHVTWNGSNAVFADLAQLEPGQEVAVDRADGSTVSFVVTRVASFAKDEFPTEEVYARTDEPSLVLITCGGEYDASRHYYDSNTIVWATMPVG